MVIFTISQMTPEVYSCLNLQSQTWEPPTNSLHTPNSFDLCWSDSGYRKSKIGII